MINQDGRQEFHLDPAVTDAIRDQREMRTYVIQAFLQEPPQMKYRYFVETLETGRRIYLERPAKKGKKDFRIFCEGYFCYPDGNDRKPSYSDIRNDLSNKKKTLTSKQLEHLKNAIQEIYDVHPYQNAAQHLSDFPAVVDGLPYEALLKLLKWMFIVEDTLYWLRRGRAMPFEDMVMPALDE